MTQMVIAADHVIWKDQILFQSEPAKPLASRKASSRILYQVTLSVDQIRRKSLIYYRKVFGIISLLLLATLGICIGLHVPYEPAAALFSCVLGTFAVFSMKVRDASKS